MGGMVTYTAHLLRALVELRSDLELTVFCSERGRQVLAAEPWSSELHLVTHRLLGRPRLSAISEVALLPSLVRASGADVLHSLAMTGPLRASVPHVVTIPDLIWRRFPSSGRATGAVWRTIVPPVARHADRIITYSEASRRDIASLIGIDPLRIHVVPLGTEGPAPTEAITADQARSRFHLGDGPVVLSVSSKKPHKNLVRLTRAMGLVAGRYPGATLVVPGSPAPHDEQLRAEADRAGARLLLPGWIEGDELEGLYAAASCVAFASLQEGFGLPVLDAMRRGVPVACSDASSLPEVGGGAVIYFDPLLPDDIARAIIELVANPAMATQLARAGRERAATFTWELVAQRHLEIYDLALAGTTG